LALNVDQNDASLERLDGVRISVNGWRASERLQPNNKGRDIGASLSYLSKFGGTSEKSQGHSP
jgi:hypothetical protein